MFRPIHHSTRLCMHVCMPRQMYSLTSLPSASDVSCSNSAACLVTKFLLHFHFFIHYQAEIFMVRLYFVLFPVISLR